MLFIIFLFLFNYLLYIPMRASYLHCNYSHPCKPSFPPSTHFFRRGSVPLCYNPTLSYLIPIGLGTSSPTDTQPGRGQGSNGREKRQTQTSLHHLEDPYEGQAHICYKCVKSLGLLPAWSLFCSLGSLNPRCPRLVKTLIF